MGQPRVSDPLLELASIVLADASLESVLDRAAHVARRAVPGADEVSVTLVEGDHAWTAAFTGDLALQADERQYERGHGPCLDAGRTGELLVIPDMAAEQRWPDYAARAVELGVGSSVSAPLPLQDQRIGALNVYARRPHAFDGDAVATAQHVAAFVAVAVHNARTFEEASALATQLQDAMRSRAVIEQAKGVVMAQRRCGPDQAIRVLIETSQRTNVKLRDVAAALVRRTAQPD